MQFHAVATALERPIVSAAHALRHVAVVVSVSLYTVLAPFGYVLFAAIAAAPALDPRRKGRWLRAAMRTGFRVMFAWMRLLRIAEVRDRAAMTGVPRGPCVVVANHPTLLDITVLLAAFDEACTLVKPDVFRKRLVRPLLEASGQIEGAVGNPLGAMTLIDVAVERLRSGMTVIIFPEATRTEPGRPMPFYRLAFEVAARASVPVVVMAFSCEPPWLSKDRPLFRPPSMMPVLTMSLLAVLDPAAFDHDSRRLCDHARKLYRGGRDHDQ